MTAFIDAERYEHGTRARYVGGCRCDDCRAANTKRYRERRAQIREQLPDVRPNGPPLPGMILRRGKPVPVKICPGANGRPCVRGSWLRVGDVCAVCVELASVSAHFVMGDRVYAHLKKLSAAGIGYKSVADAADVAHSVLGRVIKTGGWLRIRATTERAVLAVDAGAIADGALVPGERAQEIFAKLRRRGFTFRQLAELLETSFVGWKPGEHVLASRQLELERLLARVERGEITARRALPRATRERTFVRMLRRAGVPKRWLEQRLGYSLPAWTKDRSQRAMRPQNAARVRALMAELEDCARRGEMPAEWGSEAKRGRLGRELDLIFERLAEPR